MSVFHFFWVVVVVGLFFFFFFVVGKICHLEIPNARVIEKGI